jgi:uncharacterized protein YbjT (DUF2867 family)
VTARVAIVGASGYVGGRLAPHLAEAGHQVVACGRRRSALPAGERIEAREFDVGDEDAVRDVLADCDAAFYLVHSMAGGANFATRDHELAATFGRAAARAGLEKIVYLGGLGEGDLSPHLSSRQDVGHALAEGGVPVVELRAAVVLGSGSISFEMLRYLTERLPVMICPRWIHTKVQPIAEADLLAYLAESLDVPAGVYEIGGPDVTTYREMIQTYARTRGLRRRGILDVPLLTPGLSARWVDLVTPVDRTVSHALIESLTSEVIVRHPEATAAAFSVQPRSVDAALADALRIQAEELPDRLFGLPAGVHDGVYVMRGHADVAPADIDGAESDLTSCGGDLRWYGWAWAWRVRLLLGRLFGERLRLHRPAHFAVGATVDWWTVARYRDHALVLATDQWFCGEAWLGYAVRREPRPHVVQVGALRPKGLLGVAYWRSVWPIHLIVFHVMAKRQATRASRQARRRRTVRWRRFPGLVSGPVR